MANLTTDVTSRENGPASDFKKRIIDGERQLEKMAHSAGESMGAMASDLAEKTTRSIESSREYVKEHPLKGVAIAAAAGLVAGSLLTVILHNRKH